MLASLLPSTTVLGPAAAPPATGAPAEGDEPGFGALFQRAAAGLMAPLAGPQGALPCALVGPPAMASGEARAILVSELAIMLPWDVAQPPPVEAAALPTEDAEWADAPALVSTEPCLVAPAEAPALLAVAPPLAAPVVGPMPVLPPAETGPMPLAVASAGIAAPTLPETPGSTAARPVSMPAGEPVDMPQPGASQPTPKLSQPEGARPTEQPTGPTAAPPAALSAALPAATLSAMPVETPGSAAVPPTNAAAPTSASELPRTVTLALPPGAVPVLVPPPRPPDAGSGNLVAAQTGAAAKRSVRPGEPGLALPPSAPATRDDVHSAAPTASAPELARPPATQSAGGAPPPPAGLIVESTASVARRSHDPTLAAPTPAQPAVTADPPHVAPPSPTRQVLPLTIAMLISPGGAPTLTVTLEPGEMGRLEIRVGRDAEGTTLRLIAERPETAALLQRDGRELQQGLAQSGIRLDAGAISYETAGGGRGETGHPRDRPPPRARNQGAGHMAAEPDAPLSLLDLRI